MQHPAHLHYMGMQGQFWDLTITSRIPHSHPFSPKFQKLLHSPSLKSLQSDFWKQQFIIRKTLHVFILSFESALSYVSAGNLPWNLLMSHFLSHSFQTTSAGNHTAIFLFPISLLKTPGMQSSFLLLHQHSTTCHCSSCLPIIEFFFLMQKQHQLLWCYFL